LDRAERELARSRMRIESAGPSGTASDATLAMRGYDVDPHGGHRAPAQGAKSNSGLKPARRRRAARRLRPR
jgi:hypothetical protein